MFTTVSTLQTILSSMRIPCENYANAFASWQGKVFTVDRSASKDYLLNGPSTSRPNRKDCEGYRDDSTREKLLEDFLNAQGARKIT